MYGFCPNYFNGHILFELIILRLLGLQYDSFGSIVIFFGFYLLLELPLSLIANAIPKALKTVGVIQSSKGWLLFSLNAVLTFTLITLMDTMMTSVKINWKSAIIFSLITGFISWKLKKKEEEPPMIGSEDFELILRKRRKP